jgi:hypothetical protein
MCLSVCLLQQQIHSQVILPSIITATTSHQQVPNIHHTNNLVGQNMTPWKSSLLLQSKQITIIIRMVIMCIIDL